MDGQQFPTLTEVTPEAIQRAAAGQIADLLRRADRWRPLPHQIAPEGDWQGWALVGGRGSGKTDTCSNFVTEHVNGPACLNGPAPHWIGIVAPTLGDAATSCFYGPSGIRAHDESARLVSGPGGLTIKWPNGSEAKLFGAREPEDIERLRAGGNRCLVWAEEMAAWRYLEQCFEQIRFGLRSGPRPRWIGSTTPKPRPLIKKIVKGEVRSVAITHATTFDNPHLPEHIREALEESYGGREIGRQELYAELLESDENALWSRASLEEYRVSDVPQDLRRITVGVDPSGGAGEQGIVVVGKQIQYEDEGNKKKPILHGYVLDDRTVSMSPAEWGKKAVRAAVDWEVDDIVVERNFGGDMAKATIIGAAEAMGIDIPVRDVRASRGKQIRAEPVAALAGRGQWHHVGRFDALEDQLCVWSPDSNYSPDRLDAMVWGAWHMQLVGTIRRGKGSFGGKQMSQTLIG